MACPGLAVILRVGATSVVAIIPENFPLPTWYKTPDESESSRLQTLAMEWSLNFFPPDIEVDEYATIMVEHCSDEMTAMKPTEWAKAVNLQFTAEEAENPEASDITLLIAVTEAPFSQSELDDIPPDMPEAVEPAFIENTQAIPLQTTGGPGFQNPLLNQLPVSINVRLAEKKLDLEQLMNISPGTLITFNKSCEDLLELYVNNSLYCRGEAVKIGEKFGLKISEVNSRHYKESSILN